MSERTTRWFHLLGLLAVLVLGLEAGSWLLLRLGTGQTAAEVRRRLMQPVPPAGLERLRTGNEGPEWLRNKVLHPYVGFVGNPDHPGSLAQQLNEFGFHGQPPPLAGETGQAVVAITGGSVAMNFFFHVQTHETFVRELRRLPAFAGRDVLVVSLALDGMKQPQQLMTLNYFLSLGRKIDYVINLDGFNEAVLPYTDNLPHGVSPFYPRAWNWFAAQTMASSQAVQFGRIALSRLRGYVWQRRLAATPLRYSVFCLTTWHLLDRRRRARELAWEAELQGAGARTDGAPKAVHGPAYPARTLSEVLRDSVAVWRRSSVQMWRLCAANDIGYLHALQPNQYVAGSKPLSDEERRDAIGSASFAFRRPAEEGFPILRRSGRQLAAQGVAFEDLTDVFAAVEETVYIDRCCHLNAAGYERVGRRILAGLARLTGAAPPGADASDRTP